ncbi:hypothetical protein M5K25_005482 [Dendrobium thyrsiflorum]|uniref:Uncharacterized protein n=1 Tax=Dendrobium thyrsiflorum TaxID=117978 RepID=A0ABD0VIK8_DENTH
MVEVEEVLPMIFLQVMQLLPQAFYFNLPELDYSLNKVGTDMLMISVKIMKKHAPFVKISSIEYQQMVSSKSLIMFSGCMVSKSRSIVYLVLNTENDIFYHFHSFFEYLILSFNISLLISSYSGLVIGKPDSGWSMCFAIAIHWQWFMLFILSLKSIKCDSLSTFMINY